MKVQPDQLLVSQLKTWKLAAENYAGLSHVMTREIEMNGFTFRLQFNPGRIRSSAAKVDAQSIRERACFLCPTNRPPEQISLPYPPEYQILVNPYPIFPGHLTIPSERHVNQLITGRIRDMLRLAGDMPEWVVFYNGPKSGASAPDHFHFQAGTKGLMPVEKDFFNFHGKRVLSRKAAGTLYELEGYIRKVFVLESVNIDWLVNEFEHLLFLLKRVQYTEPEPMINILVLSEGDVRRIFLFPRIKHRPSQFFEEGEKQVMFSPGAVDFGGLLIIPREEDFEKLDKGLVVDMFSQITYPDEMWNTLLHNIANSNI